MGTSASKGLGHRKRSLSDGNIRLPLSFQNGLHGNCASTRMPIPAREIDNPSINGYLERLVPGGNWNSCWCVLKDSKLFRYKEPIDDATEDILDLGGYEVLEVPKIGEKDFVFEVLHNENNCETFCAESGEERLEWVTKLRQAAQKLSIEGLNLEKGRSSEFDEVEDTERYSSDQRAEEWEKEVVELKKQQLLQEVLQERQRLEHSQRRKLKVRGKLAKQASEESFHVDDLLYESGQRSSDTLSMGSGTSSTQDEALRNITHLKQRKISTQLKVDSLQKQIQTLQNRKQKKKFKIGRVAKDDFATECVPASVSQIHNQLQELTSELHHIDHNIQEAQTDLAATSDTILSETLQVNHKSRNGVSSIDNADVLLASYRKRAETAVLGNSDRFDTSSVGPRPRAESDTNVPTVKPIRSGDTGSSPKGAAKVYRRTGEMTTLSRQRKEMRKSWESGKGISGSRENLVQRTKAESPRITGSKSPQILHVKEETKNPEKLDSCLDPMAEISAFEDLIQKKLQNL